MDSKTWEEILKWKRAPGCTHLGALCVFMDVSAGDTESTLVWVRRGHILPGVYPSVQWRTEPWEEGSRLAASGTLLNQQHCLWLGGGPDFPASVGGTDTVGRLEGLGYSIAAALSLT